MKKSLIFCLLALLLLFCGKSMAGTYYVDQQNSLAQDINEGTQAEPWKTIQHAANVLQAGDTVLVKNGVYTERTAGFPESDMRGIKIQHSGTAGSYITFKNYPGHRPILDLQNSGVGFIISGKSHVIISGFEIRNIKGATDRSAGVVSMASSSHIIVENNYIHHVDGIAGSNVAGIRFDLTKYAVARNNRVHTVRVNGVLNGNASGLTGFQYGDTLVENNEFYDAYNGVYHKQANSTDGMLVQKNRIHNVIRGLFYDVAGAGNAPHVNQRVTQNIIYDADIAVWQEARDASGINQGLTIWNNTFAPISTGIWASNTHNITIYNNIIDGPLSKDSLRFRPPTLINEINYNLYSGSSRMTLNLFEGDDQQIFPSVVQWTNSEGHDADSLTVDPNFIDRANHDYRLTSQSPARSSGKNGINIGAYINDNDVIGLLDEATLDDQAGLCIALNARNNKTMILCL